MRTASRFMPRAAKRRPHPLAYPLLAAFAGAYGYGLWKAPLVCIGLTIFLVGMGFGLAHYQRWKLNRLAEARNRESICTFARAFDARSIDPWVIRAVYEQLQEHLKPTKPPFPLLPTDRLRQDLMLDDDDLDMDLVPDIAARTGRPLSGSAENPYFGKVVTVRDLVEFFCAQPKSAT